MIEERVALLQTINGGDYGVNKLMQLIRFQHDKIIALLRDMEKEGLIIFLKNNNSKRRGRPKKIPRITELGEQMIFDFQKCRRNIIQINDNDIKHCKRQIALREILEKNNISSYQSFFELTDFVFNIRNSINL